MRRSSLRSRSWVFALPVLVAGAGLEACSADGPATAPPSGQTDFVSAPPGGQTGGGATNASAGATTAAPTATGGAALGTKPTSTRTVQETDLYRLEGTRLYYLNSYRGLMVFDVTNVDQPKLLGRSAIFGTPVDMIVEWRDRHRRRRRLVRHARQRQPVPRIDRAGPRRDRSDEHQGRRRREARRLGPGRPRRRQRPLRRERGLRVELRLGARRSRPPASRAAAIAAAGGTSGAGRRERHRLVGELRRRPGQAGRLADLRRVRRRVQRDAERDPPRASGRPGRGRRLRPADEDRPRVPRHLGSRRQDRPARHAAGRRRRRHERRRRRPMEPRLRGRQDGARHRLRRAASTHAAARMARTSSPRATSRTPTPPRSPASSRSRRRAGA